jgi:hypothetical protein
VTKKADTKQLDGLHQLLASYLEDVLRNGEEVIHIDRESGERTVTRVKPSAAMTNQIRTFLKDNHIEVDPTKSKRMNVLAGLPFPGDDDADPDTQGAPH